MISRPVAQACGSSRCHTKGMRTPPPRRPARWHTSYMTYWAGNGAISTATSNRSAQTRSSLSRPTTRTSGRSRTPWQRPGCPAGVRIGTVDKFQGREAPVAIYSMATSSADDAPRGLEFLYDPHRLNVATSRARAMAIIVASPDLIRVSCRTPRQMYLVNALCTAWESGE